jgi:hypothetical protein
MGVAGNPGLSPRENDFAGASADSVQRDGRYRAKWSVSLAGFASRQRTPENCESTAAQFES